jgi:predicted nucleotidyltransferase
MQTLIDQRRPEIAALCRRYAVRRLEVFGSAALGTDFDLAASDADFLVDFDPPGEMSPLIKLIGGQSKIIPAIPTASRRSTTNIRASFLHDPDQIAVAIGEDKGGGRPDGVRNA